MGDERENQEQRSVVASSAVMMTMAGLRCCLRETVSGREQFRPERCKIVMVRDRGLNGGLVKTASRPKVLTEYLTILSRRLDTFPGNFREIFPKKFLEIG